MMQFLNVSSKLSLNTRKIKKTKIEIITLLKLDDLKKEMDEEFDNANFNLTTQNTSTNMA